MDIRNKLFSTNQLSKFLEDEFNKIYNNIEIKMENGNLLQNIQNELSNFNNYILNVDYDISYQPGLRKESTGEGYNKRVYYVLKQRFKFTGNEKLFYLKPSKFDSNPPIGLVNKNFLYFEIFLPNQENLTDLAKNKVLEFEKDILYYTSSQEKDIIKFISENLKKIEQKFIELNKENSFQEQFLQEFTKSIKNNLLTKESTEIPQKDEEIEDFIKELRDKNGK